MKWIKTQFPGVRYREHPTRKHGVKFDRYFALQYKMNGRVMNEALGWASEGVTAEKAFIKLQQLKANRKEGTGPSTLREERAENEASRKAKAAKLKREAEAQKTLCDYWKESYFPAAKRSKKESSWIKEEQHFKLWIEPLLGQATLRSISLKQWDELVKTLSSANLSQRSKEYITGTLRRILKHAYDRRMLDEAPPTGKRTGVTGPGNNRRLRVISHEEEAAILDGILKMDPHAWRITRFAFLTGCRVSEAFTLKWANVDLSRGVITLAETKNRDHRTIPITPPLIDLFAGMEVGAPDALVFRKADGNGYSQAPFCFSTTIANLGLNDGRSRRDKITFHSIRHTVATRLAQRLGPRDLMDVMGWRTVQMAMRYVHANEDAKMKALSMLGTPPATDNVIPFQKAGTQ